MSGLGALKRKFDQFRNDPVLRRWIMYQAKNGHPFRRKNHQARPPYLMNKPAMLSAACDCGFEIGPDIPPSAPLRLELPGEEIVLNTGAERVLFQSNFPDHETYLAVQRFAWIATAASAPDPAWVNRLWRSWADAHGSHREGWPWHPYTAAERVVNILSYAARHGLPGPKQETLSLLRKHCQVIADTIEYFGEGATGNHLANNGRGLYLAGLALGLGDAVEMGGAILLEEAKRLFLSSGILREGSSHYHLLLTRAYLECWLAARRNGRPESEELGEIALKALAVMPRLRLGEHFPLIGDVSPDCTPSHLIDVLTGEHGGWSGHAGADAGSAVKQLNDALVPTPIDKLVADGWVRLDAGKWSGLWYAATDGWGPQPGHAHQDFRGFELSFAGEAVFRDLGRRSYGAGGDQDVAAEAHNTILIDGQAPYPRNRAYYDQRFREKIGGASPTLERSESAVSISHHGFARLAGVEIHTRSWQFGQNSLRLTDRVAGRGRHRISRRFHTTLPVKAVSGGVDIGRHMFLGAAPIKLSPAQRWYAYGTGEPATTIEVASNVDLPWQSTLELRTP